MAGGRPTIYTLSDMNGVRYVGQAKNVQKRYSQHCSLAQNQGNTRKNRWVRSLLRKGLSPLLNVVMETDDLDTNEVRFIKMYREKGCNLVNTANGGKDMLHTLHAKRKMPWGKTHSPVQYRLKMISETIRMFRKKGDTGKVRRLEEKQNHVLATIKRTGRDVMNMRLWNKYGY